MTSASHRSHFGHCASAVYLWHWLSLCLVSLTEPSALQQNRRRRCTHQALPSDGLNNNKNKNKNQNKLLLIIMIIKKKNLHLQGALSHRSPQRFLVTFTVTKYTGATDALSQADKTCSSHTHTHTHTHARTHAHKHTHTHARKHAYTHTNTHTRSHARTHTHTRTHTHQSVSWWKVDFKCWFNGRGWLREPNFFCKCGPECWSHNYKRKNVRLQRISFLDMCVCAVSYTHLTLPTMAVV